MKKVAYLSMLFITLALMSFSCEKDPITPDPTVSIYVGKWTNDETRVNDVVDVNVSQYEFEFQSVKAIVTAKNNSATNRAYLSWSVSGNTLKLIGDDIADATYTIVSPPNNNKLVLSQGIYTYYLSK